MPCSHVLINISDYIRCINCKLTKNNVLDFYKN